ncbi:MAG: hypothetical protein GC159_18765 [Phycisphaera sp.]|nr:hypothetical protein [Phycisphaera sp.]
MKPYLFKTRHPVAAAMVLLGAITLATQTVHAQDNADAPPADPWRIDFNSWIWLMGVHGDVGAGPVRANVDASFGDVLDASDSLFAFSGRLEVGRGRFTGFLDGMYANIGADDQSGPLGKSSIDVTSQMGIIDFGVMYRVLDWDTGHSKRQASLDGYVGGRVMFLSLELDPDKLGTSKRERSWADAIVGAKVCYPLSDRFHLNVWGDVGGGSSDLTWSVTGVLGYDFELFNMPGTVYAGYRAIGWDYGHDNFEWDVTLHGPTLGLQFLF